MKLKILLDITFFILAAGSGFWLSKTGRPLNTLIFTLHKFFMIGFVVCSILLTIYLLKQHSADPLLLITGIINGVCLLGIVVTGGMLSFEKTWPGIIRMTHTILPLITATCSFIFIYFSLKSAGNI